LTCFFSVGGSDSRMTSPSTSVACSPIGT
jgi:hypothetical protein